MKSEYISPTKERGLRFLLAAQSIEEQRLLTILRDIGLDPDKDIVLRVDGAEWSDKPVRGLPDKPVTRLSITVERRSGKPYSPKDGQPMDPTKYVQVERTSSTPVGRGAGKGNIRTVHMPNGTNIVEIK